MINLVKPLAMAAAVLLAGQAWAQETDTTTAEPATDSADATPDDLNFGEPLVIDESQPITQDELAQLEPGRFYSLAIYGDWRIRCIKTPGDEADPCQLYQLLKDGDNAVAEINIFPLPEGSRAAAGANIVVPLETLLTQQLTLSVDGGQARRYPFTFCNQGGCVARVGFTDAEIQQFKAGNAATIRLVPAAAPDQEIVLNMSLKGFTAGFDGAYDIPQ